VHQRSSCEETVGRASGASRSFLVCVNVIIMTTFCRGAKVCCFLRHLNLILLLSRPEQLLNKTISSVHYTLVIVIVSLHTSSCGVF